MTDKRACGCDWAGPPCDHERIHKETGRLITKRAPRVDWDPPCDDRACSLAVELDALRKVAEEAEGAVMCTVRHQGLRDALDAWRKLRVT